MNLEGLETPCLVLDRSILERNLKRMSDTVRRNGAALRPHLKTAKSAEVARMATAGEAGGITVSTLAEAEYFALRGFRDILIAASLAPDKLDRAGALATRGVAITLITDDAGAAEAIAYHPAPFKVLIEIDSGDRRAGVKPSSSSVVEIGRRLGSRLAGVMTHAGHSYECRTVECIKAVAADERAAVLTAAGLLRDAGIACDVISVGSTPTMTHAENLDGVTEARPGVYMFQDLMQAEIGSCTREDIALTVLASVIGRNVSENRILLDAGALAISKDRSTQATPHDFGYGEVVDLDGKPAFGRCTVARVYQEHGVCVGEDPSFMDALTIGAKVRVRPNHACITAAAHDRYYVVDGSREVVAEWDRVNGW